PPHPRTRNPPPAFRAGHVRRRCDLRVRPRGAAPHLPVRHLPEPPRAGRCRLAPTGTVDRPVDRRRRAGRRLGAVDPLERRPRDRYLLVGSPARVVRGRRAGPPFRCPVPVSLPPPTPLTRYPHPS